MRSEIRVRLCRVPVDLRHVSVLTTSAESMQHAEHGEAHFNLVLVAAGEHCDSR
jgi:hypothetical protein